MNREEAKRLVNYLDRIITDMQTERDRIADEYIRCEICGEKMSGPPCHGIKPSAKIP